MKKYQIDLIISRLTISFLLLASVNCITTGIYKASKNGDLATVKKLIEEGASIDESDSWSLHPLHYAAEKGNIEIAKLLLEKGASIHALDVREYTPLHFAAKEGRAEMVQFLLTKGANKELKSSTTAYERTPLDLAVIGNHEETKQVLYNWIIIEEIPQSMKTKLPPSGIYKDIVTLRNGGVLENVKTVIHKSTVTVTDSKGRSTEYKKADILKISLRRI